MAFLRNLITQVIGQVNHLCPVAAPALSGLFDITKSLVGPAYHVGVIGSITYVAYQHFSKEKMTERYMNKTAKQIKSHDVDFKFNVAKRSRKIMDQLDFESLTEALDCEEEAEIDDLLTKSSWRAAYRLSRAARTHFKYPDYSPANRLNACDWILKKLKESDTRLSQIDQILPLAVVLTFVRSIRELEADQLLDLFTRAGRVRTAQPK